MSYHNQNDSQQFAEVRYEVDMQTNEFVVVFASGGFGETF